MLIFSHFIGTILWMITAIYYARRTTISWAFVGFIIYLGAWSLAIANLLRYQLFLLRTNVTTNEAMNLFKYKYMRDEFDDFQNPFDRGHWWTNTIDSMFPMSKSFYSREEVVDWYTKFQLRNSKTDSSNDFRTNELNKLIV